MTQLAAPRLKPAAPSKLMVRPKNSAIASRDNGAKAKNKGKAKKTVPVLVSGYSDRAGRYEVWTQERAPLPKGYVAYKSELDTQMLCIENQRRVRFDTPEEKAVTDLRRKKEAAREASFKMSKDTKDWDMAKKMSKLKAMTQGAKDTFMFKEREAEPPPRRPPRRRGSR